MAPTRPRGVPIQCVARLKSVSALDTQYSDAYVTIGDDSFQLAHVHSPSQSIHKIFADDVSALIHGAVADSRNIALLSIGSTQSGKTDTLIDIVGLVATELFLILQSKKDG
uniref:Kinesin motor domain-containing protein n=1 Tax=Spongospora subterranea TaxID=70186 RepID=A0A0H5QUK2_9EUKA|eukprot:CRZ05585.1 hypothetical protein [Spongospora subterranea]